MHLASHGRREVVDEPKTPLFYVIKPKTIFGIYAGLMLCLDRPQCPLDTEIVRFESLGRISGLVSTREPTLLCNKYEISLRNPCNHFLAFLLSGETRKQGNS